MTLKVESLVEVYEVNGKEVEIGDSKQMKVLSHWNRNEFVILKFGKQEVTISRIDLQKAVENATNV